MTWSLIARRAGEADASSFALRTERTSCIALAETNDTVLIVDQYAPELQAGLRTLARVNVAGWGVKLEALSSVAVEPANPRSNEHIRPNQERYTLDSSGRTEVIFLRENDTIYFPEAGATTSVTLKYTASEVQVDSSVAADAEVPESVNPYDTSPVGIQPPPAEEDETDDEDLDRAITVGATLSNNEHRSQATPMPSLSRSEIVQETPTANRSYMATELAREGKTIELTDAADADEAVDEAVLEDGQVDASHSAEDQDGDTVMAAPGLDLQSVPKVAANETAPQDVEPSIFNGSAKQEEAHPAVPTSTEVSDHSSLFGDGSLKGSKGKTGSQPSTQPRPKRATRIINVAAQISETGLRKNKRKLVDTEEDPAEASTHTTKRTKKTPNGTQDSALSSGTPVSRRKSPATKLRRRVSTSELNALLSQSPPATPISDLELDWQDYPPNVAFSNSALAEMENLKKFIRAREGAIVEDVAVEKCNVLCVRDGPIRKSVKLLSCIALGIPIVTDRWLTESARKKQLLAVKDFIPKVPKQEKEWRFSLQAIWGRPQNRLLDGYTVFFTSALAKTYQDFSEVERLCRLVGASKVHKSARSAGSMKDSDKVLVFGLEDQDVECAALLKGGRPVYSRDTLASSILRGGFDLDSDEFMIQPGGSPKASSSQNAAPKKRGRPRKS